MLNKCLIKLNYIKTNSKIPICSYNKTHICVMLIYGLASQVAQWLRILLASAGTAGDLFSIPGWKDPLEEVTATHSNILAVIIPWKEEFGGLQSMGLQRVKYD